MGFRCSILGHDFGDPEVVREREEDGSEVIITVREMETCARCGEQRVVSENKEVTTLETAADIVADDLGDGPGQRESDSQRRGDEPATPDATETPDDAGPTDTVDEPTADPQSADTGIGGEDGGVSVPDAEGDSAGGVDLPSDEIEDDAVILDDEDDTDERAPGEWPEQTRKDEEDDRRVETEPSADERPDVESTGDAVTVPKGEYHCPECSYTTPVAESSLREGDFCPECHRGALEHRS